MNPLVGKFQSVVFRLKNGGSRGGKLFCGRFVDRSLVFDLLWAFIFPLSAGCGCPVSFVWLFGPVCFDSDCLSRFYLHFAPIPLTL